MISIIVPVYKAEKYLRQCIDSIIAQTYKDWELLLVVDGGNDNSEVICDEYAEKFPSIRVFHQQNAGVSSARNVGLENARGEWITFADADDWLESSAFETYINAFNRYNVDVVRTGFYHEHEDGGVEKTCISEDMLCDTTLSMFRETEKSHYYSFIWNTCLKREIVGDNRFDISLNWLEDHTFMYRCYFNCSSMAILVTPTYHYMRRGGTDSLAFVKSPFVIQKASLLELELKTKLIDGKDERLQHEVEELYRYRLNMLVSAIYNQKTTYQMRKNIAETTLVIPGLKYKYERLFFSHNPFILRDVIIRIICMVNQLRSHKKRNL